MDPCPEPVIVRCGEESFSCAEEVLHRSPYFSRLLNAGMKELGTRRIDLPCSPAVFQALYHFLQGELEFSSLASPLLRELYLLADAHCHDELRTYCEEARIAALTLENATDAITDATMIQAPRLLRAALYLLRQHWQVPEVSEEVLSFLMEEKDVEVDDFLVEILLAHSPPPVHLVRKSVIDYLVTIASPALRTIATWSLPPEIDQHLKMALAQSATKVERQLCSTLIVDIDSFDPYHLSWTDPIARITLGMREAIIYHSLYKGERWTLRCKKANLSLMEGWGLFRDEGDLGHVITLLKRSKLPDGREVGRLNVVMEERAGRLRIYTNLPRLFSPQGERIYMREGAVVDVSHCLFSFRLYRDVESGSTELEIHLEEAEIEKRRRCEAATRSVAE